MFPVLQRSSERVDLTGHAVVMKVCEDRSRYAISSSELNAHFHNNTHATAKATTILLENPPSRQSRNKKKKKRTSYLDIQARGCIKHLLSEVRLVWENIVAQHQPKDRKKGPHMHEETDAQQTPALPRARSLTLNVRKYFRSPGGTPCSSSNTFLGQSGNARS